MKRELLSVVTIAALTTTPFAFASEESDGVTVEGNVALASDYIWRGQTQTLNEAAISGGFDLGLDSGIYLGVWGSNVDFGANDNVEIDYYGGVAGEFSAVGYDLGYIDYNYPGGSGDFEEWYLGLSSTVSDLELGVTFSFGVDNAADNVEASVATELSDVGVGLTFGDYDNAGKYTSLAISKELAGVELSLTWSDFDADAGTASDQDDVTFAIAKSFQKRERKGSGLYFCTLTSIRIK